MLYLFKMSLQIHNIKFPQVYLWTFWRANKRSPFLQKCIFVVFFFFKIMLESWGCSLYTSAAYTQVFTVLSSPGCLLQVHGIKCKIGGYLNKRMHMSCMNWLLSPVQNFLTGKFFFWVEKFHKSHDIKTTKYIFSTILRWVRTR